MKYTIDEMRHAARVLKETCGEHSNDCWECPLCIIDGWGDHTCILDDEWPEGWNVDRIGEAMSD